MPPSSFHIVYKCPDDKPCFIWKRDNASNFVVTLMNSPSGSGKTALLGGLYDRLKGRKIESDGLMFDFDPDYNFPDNAAVGVIPQNPPMVNHWRLQEILPKTSMFIKCFFPEENGMTAFWKKRLGEFSGGQIRKLYTCSALERMAIRCADQNFLLLDETFDGLGVIETKRCLSEIKTTWLDKIKKPIHLLVVTHLNDEEVTVGAVSVSTVSLSVMNSNSDELCVSVLNKR